MANKQISDLPSKNTLAGTDVFAIDSNGVTYKITGAAIAEGLEPIGNYVTGVKGNSESTYRTGDVNITKANIGLGNVDNTSDADKPVSTAMQTALDAKASVIVEEITTPASVMSFPDGAPVNAHDLVVEIEPVQSGSGDPSPENVRPISGWTGANVVVSPTTDAQDGTTYPISWQAEAGTVYGGTLDVTTGLLTVTMAEVDLGTLTWLYDSGDHSRMRASLNDVKRPSADTDIANILCSQYRTDSVSNIYNHIHDKSIGLLNSNNFIWVYDSAYSNPNEFQADMSGVQLVYELATPQTYQLTPTQVALLLGQNNIWADTGDVQSVEYQADTKLYIDKKIAALA